VQCFNGQFNLQDNDRSPKASRRLAASFSARRLRFAERMPGSEGAEFCVGAE
jgi:hypothetical protein